MRTLGEMLIVVAALALIAIWWASGFTIYGPGRRRALKSPDSLTYRSPNRLKYFDEHDPSSAVLWLLVAAVVGVVLRRYG